MKRLRTSVVRISDAEIDVKARIPNTLWKILEEWANRMGVTTIQAYSILLKRIVSMIESGNYSLLGTDYEQVISTLAAQDKLGSQGLPAIADLAHKLHRAKPGKNGSGFVGVYTNGKGYRAVGKLPSGKGGVAEHTIGTYPTAEQAALARYLHYKKHGLPYGELETLIEKKREVFGSDYSTVEMLEEVNLSQRLSGKPEFSFEDDEEAVSRKLAGRPMPVFGITTPVPNAKKSSKSETIKEQKPNEDEFDPMSIINRGLDEDGNEQ